MTGHPIVHTERDGVMGKECGTCHEWKALARYSKKGKGLCSKCKACARKQENAAYAADPQKFRDRVNAARAADPQKFRDRDNAERASDPQKFRDRSNANYQAGEDFAFRRAAASSPSGQEICSFPGCKVTLRFHLEFHHVDPTTKLSAVAELYQAPRERLAAEVDKCVLYCQHHHFQFHHPAPTPNPHPLFRISPEAAARLAVL